MIKKVVDPLISIPRNFVLVLSLVACFSCELVAQRLQEDLPAEADGIGVEQKLGDELPLHLEFDDDHNNHIQLGELFQGKRPVLLSFNYSDCPKLCMIQLSNLASALQLIDLVPGKDFEIVSVSLDPTEQASQLRETKKKYVAAYGNLESAPGWHFVKSDKRTIRELADSCGFIYKYIPEQRLYSHPAAFIFCSPDGRIARYLDGLDGYLEKSLKPALLEAGEGKIGSLTDKVLYFAGCYSFDPSTGKYSPLAIGVMRLGAGATILALVVGVLPYWLRRRITMHGRGKALDERAAANDQEVPGDESPSNSGSISPH